MTYLDENKALIVRLLRAWEKVDLAVVDELVAADCIDHNPLPGQGPGREGIKQVIGMFDVAFPDTRFDIDEVLAEGDKVVARWTSYGTHKGELMGIAATGKETKVTGILIGRVIDGKFVEFWGEFDSLGLMVQLGVVPPMEREKAA